MNLFKKPNVVLVGKGHKIVKGIDTGRDAIVVGVSHKVPLAVLKKREIIPLNIKGVETDVIEVGEIRALRTTKQRPAPGGVSIGHYKITAGTLGMVVKKDGIRHILSNNHVLANSNDAYIGDSIYQPGPHDGGTEADTIAHLVSFEPIQFIGASDCPIGNFVVNAWNKLAGLLRRQTRLQAITEVTNLVDCAIASPIKDEDISDEILEIGIPTGFAEVEIGTKVKKSGRTTGLNEGMVTILEAIVQVGYGSKVAVFTDQIITSKLAEGGDSGSVVLNENNEVIGLLFAGSDQVTIVNDIFSVIDALELDG